MHYDIYLEKDGHRVATCGSRTYGRNASTRTATSASPALTWGAMMCLFKLARIATGHGKADNWIDLAGYAACGGELEAI